MNEKIEKLEQTIGYSFQDKLLVKRALTHTSFSNEQRINKNGDYERLEFLGDAVLELCMSKHLYFLIQLKVFHHFFQIQAPMT